MSLSLAPRDLIYDHFLFVKLLALSLSLSLALSSLSPFLVWILVVSFSGFAQYKIEHKSLKNVIQTLPHYLMCL